MVLLALLAVALPASADAPTVLWGSQGKGDGQFAEAARGVAVDATGHVYVADPGNKRVQKFTADGVFVAWRGLGEGQGRINHPEGLAVDGAGRLYIAERQNDRVLRYSTDGESLGTVGAPSGPGRLDGPSGLATDPDGRLYVANSTSRRIEVFSQDGRHLRGWSDPALAEPAGIAVGAEGAVYVADARGRSIGQYTAEGELVRRWTGDATGAFVRPAGVATDRCGAVHVADEGAGQVLRFSASGQPLGRTGAPGSEPGRLAEPWGVAADAEGRIYVVDAGNHRVQRFPSMSPGGGCEEPPEDPPPTPLVEEEAPRSEPPPPDPPMKPSSEPPPPPRRPELLLGVTFRAERLAGTVLVRPPATARARAARAGGSRRLEGAAVLPIGSTLDARDGRVRLTFATAPRDGLGETQTGEFFGGAFEVFQSRTASLADLRLAGKLTGCGPRAQTARRRGARRRSGRPRRRGGTRRLWGRTARGRFRTSGRNGAATVRGTEWLTEDRCDGTLFRVKRGSVRVRDDVRGRNVTLGAGQRYSARDACASRRRFRIRLRIPAGQHVRHVSVRAGRRPAPVRLGRRVTALIDLRGRPRGTVVVSIRVLTHSGIELSGKRVYRTCSDRRDGGAPPGL